jgi:predicted nucleic acid-binding protein
LTNIADTRLLLILEFPPTPQAKVKTRDFFEKQLREGLIAPSIVLAEFIKYAGARIGEEAAKNRLRLLKERGMKVVAIDEECGLAAGSLLLSHRNVPLADALIASFVTTGIANCVITDDPHYKTLNTKTKWIP